MAIKIWPKPFQYFRDVKMFFISLGAVVALFVSGIYLYRYFSINRLLLHTIRQQAETFADLIVMMRHWNSMYGGVYVEKKPGIVSNPYLKELGIDPDIATKDGRILTMRNPAIMTRELSMIAREKEGVRFHMVSLRYLNPENAPDEFERDALVRFDKGAEEAWRIDRSVHPPMFRYVRPLRTDESCLKCHSKQGYKLGDVRGGISVSVPAAVLFRNIGINRREMAIFAVFTICMLLSILYFMTWKLVVRLDETQK